MSWAEIKKSVNETLGTFRDTPLNQIVSYESYDSFYNLAKFANFLLGSDDNSVLIIPKGKNSIDQGEFVDGSMEIVIIPSTVKTIGVSAFNLCLRLKEVFMPNSVKTIEASAFANCTKLENIFIPSSVDVISSSAFSTCTKLTDIYIDRPKNAAPTGAPWGANNATVHYKD